MRSGLLVLSLLFCPLSALAEVTRVTINTRGVVADGQSFGSSGPYEKLVGRIEFALDPADPRNSGIVDLQHAPRAADGRVHFTSDLHVLRPTNAARGNGVLFFEIANRGRKGLLTRFNGARASDDPTSAADFADGLLMREGYTLVWVGWEFDVPSTPMTIDAPLITTPATNPLRVSFTLSQRQNDAVLTDAPLYPPADPADRTAMLSVRDRFWDPPTPIAREKWRFVQGAGAPRVAMDGAFEPGRLYEVSYRAAGRRVAGVGMAAIRDAASAFRSRTDLQIAGQRAYVFGASQSGRFLRDFLHDGFNADEQGRQVFDAVWPHIAGSAGGSFNEAFATPTSLTSFRATRFPFTDESQQDSAGLRDGLLARYKPDQRPKIFHTNTSVEYWGLGRAAALAHVSLTSHTDIELPQNVRIYLLAGSQHGESTFPPSRTAGQELGNPMPQRDVMRALLKGLDQWVRQGVRPPESRYPRFSDRTLVPAQQVGFPSLPAVGDPRTITGPARTVSDKNTPWPFLVPQVDGDGNEIAGIRVPDLAVPLATTTGWNFRSVATGNPGEIVALAGSYIPFSRTQADRQTRHDPRPSVEERYPNRDAYLQKVRAVAAELVKDRYLLADDLENVTTRAQAHWDYATRGGEDRDVESHRAAAKAAARDEHVGLFNRLCVPPAPAATRQPVAPGPPDRSLWHVEPAKVFDNLYFVGEKEYSAWAVTTSAGIILIDSIYDYSVEDEVVNGLRALGLDPASIKYVVISHAHRDHVGGARYLQERFGARVVMSADDWDLIERTPGPWPKPARDLVVQDGHRLTLGDTTVTLYLTPGHTLGTISTVVPVRDGAQRHVAAAWGGTAFNWTTNKAAYITPERPERFWFETYSASARRFRDIVAKSGADVLIANHADFDGSKRKLPRLASRQPGAPHPYVVGNESVQRYLTVADECAQAGMRGLR